MSADDAVLREYADAGWSDGPTRGVEDVVESGKVLVFPHLAFALAEEERRFLDPRWADGKAKNVSLRWPAGELRGATGDLFPHYLGRLRRGSTSFRPIDVAGRAQSWRHDDTRLHVDAFPSNPMQGTRLLRVFCNVNPHGQPRRWRVGEPFEAHARRYLGSIGKPWPGSAWLLHALGLTKARRTGYDHFMLQLHDRAKADLEFQRASPQQQVDFAPGTTWVCFSDQVLHAAMGGQHMLEQTFYLDARDLANPASAPLAVLERLAGEPLLA
jgi:hypothetical protein